MGRGFTIVELIIVIAVIGILASISLVAYNGIQNEARTAKRAATADAYEKLLSIHRARHGAFPQPSNPSVSPCLGERSHYPARDGFPAGVCYQYAAGGATNTAGAVDDSFNAELKSTSLDSLPDASYAPVDVNIEGYVYRMRGVIVFFNSNSLGLGYIDKDDGKPCSGRFLASTGGMPGAKVCEVRVD